VIEVTLPVPVRSLSAKPVTNRYGVPAIVTQFVVQWAGVIAILLAGLGAALWAAVTYAATETGKLTAVLASLAGALGLSWKGVGGTLGKLSAWCSSRSGTPRSTRHSPGQ